MTHIRTAASSRRLALLGLAMAGTLALTGCAVPPTGAAASGNLMQRMDALLLQAAPAARVSLRVTPDTVATGQPVRVVIQSSHAGYVYLFQIGTDGRKLDMVFPNSEDIANGIAAGVTLQLPRPNWRMRTAGPAGVGYLMAVVATEPQDLMALTAATQRQELLVKGPYGASMAPLKEINP